MKKVIRTKNPSYVQASHMTDNLHEKFKVDTSISITHTSYGEPGRFVSWLYIENHDKTSKHFYSWKAIQDKYFKLMKG